MLAPSTTASTYMLQVDGTQCFTVRSDATVSPNTWVWTASATDGTAVTLNNLAAGAHTLTLIGTAPGVMLDSMFLTSDLTCQPTGDGTNCGSSVSVSVSPSVSPSSSASAGGGSTATPASQTAAKSGSSNLGFAIGVVLVLAGLGLFTVFWLKRRNAGRVPPNGGV